MTIRFVSYNVLADSYINPEWYPAESKPWLEPVSRHPALAEAIMAMDADVLALQEVELEGETLLLQLANRTQRSLSRHVVAHRRERIRKATILAILRLLQCEQLCDRRRSSKRPHNEASDDGRRRRLDDAAQPRIPAGRTSLDELRSRHDAHRDEDHGWRDSG